MTRLMRRVRKRPDAWVWWGTALVLTALRLALCGGLYIKFVPDTGYDDMMQIVKAFSITNGQWLGDYGSMTLVKGSGYPLITAALHACGIPYLLGWNLIYVAACAVFVWAVYPLLRRTAWAAFLAYGLMLFNPIAFDSNVNRYYRDIGYYSLAFLAVSFLMAMLTRKRNGWAALAGGAALSLAALTREDSQWLYIYAAGCLIASFIFLVPDWKKALRQLGVCAAALACGWLAVSAPVSAMNHRYYGTWALDEYNAGSYAQAYGALSRLDGGLRDPHTTIPTEQRMLLYQNSTAFAELYPYLDAPDALYGGWKEIQGEYRTGYFSFVLRSAAEKAGKYETAETADAYFTLLAQQVNAYCDSLPDAGPRRKGVAARFYPEYVPAILRAWGQGILYTAGCRNITAVPVQVEADDRYLAIFETYTNSVCAANRCLEDGTIVENYHPSGLKLWLQRGCRAVILLYRYSVPVLLCLAAAAWLWQGLALLRKRTGLPRVQLWVAQSSLLCAFLLREAMLAYVQATTFQTIDNPAYQAASYPLMLAFTALSLLPLLCRERGRSAM